ncbi:MAG: hypothetical protein ICV73_09830 [Acetobacteraceae bacterium]|nr:hypothetical protein [Acetobacteraceae bacterium]
MKGTGTTSAPARRSMLLTADGDNACVRMRVARGDGPVPGASGRRWRNAGHFQWRETSP